MSSVSSPKSSSDVQSTPSFENNFKNFMEAVLDLRRSTTDHFDISKNEDPYWVKCVTNLYTVFMGSDDFDDFKHMFVTFFNKNKKNLTTSITNDNGINDGWLKNREILPSPFSDGKKKNNNYGWASSQKLEGLVLYFDTTNKDMRSYCIPISKIHIEACSYYDKQFEKNGANSHLPALILYSFYSLIADVCPTNKSDIEKNIKILKQIVDELKPADKEADSSFTPMKNMVKMLAKSSNMSAEDTNKFTGAFDKIFSAETAKKVGDAVKSVSESLKTEPGDDPAASIDNMLSKIGGALQKSELRDLLVDQAKTVANLEASIPKGDAPASSSNLSETSTSSSSGPSLTSAPVDGADEQE